MLLATGALLLVGGASGADQPAGTAAGWESLLGDRPSAQLGGRWIVVLAKPSLATRVAAAGGIATEEQERAWTLAAKTAQRDVLARLAFRGVPIEPEHAYYRVFNGFATPLDARALAIVVRDPDVRGVFPVRAAIPAEVGPDADDDPFGARRGEPAGCGDPGLHRRRSHRCAARHRRRPRTSLHSLRSPARLRRARPERQRERAPEPHRSRPAGAPRHRDGGPRGGRGRAGRPGRRCPRGRRCCRSASPAGSPTRRGGVSVYGRTDQLLAGIELAVDPNEDGDAHDAARVQLVGVVEPFAAFTDGPLAAAAAGATALDSLVVAPAGNDGPAGPAYGSIGGPGGAPAALTAGAIDTRRRSPTGHVLLLAGLRTLVSGVQPLGGVVAPSLSVSAPVVALPARDPGRRRCRRWLRAPVRRRRLQPRRRRRSPTAAGHVLAGGRARGRCRGCTRGARRRPTAGRVARHRRAGRGADPRALGDRRGCRAARSPRLGPGDARRRRGCVRRERRARRRGAVLVRGAGVRRRPEARGQRCRNRSRDVRPWPRRGRRRALRNAQRLERCRRAHRRGRRAARPGAP